MFSGKLKVAKSSPTLLINEQSRMMQDDGKQVIRFGFGQSPFPPPPYAIEEFSRHTYRKDYAPVQGIPELRTAIATFHNTLDGTNFDADDVIVGPGSKQLIFNLLLCFTEANVFIPAPAWVSYEPQSVLANQPFVRVNASGPSWRVTAEQLDAAFAKPPLPNAPKVLIYNNPGNPDGTADSRESLMKLAEVCRKHDVLVVSDEIYGQLHHEGEHVCFSALYEKAILSTGISKWAGAGGWRVGAFAFPKGMDDLKAVFLGVASESYSCVTTPAQFAAVKAYEVRDEFHAYVKAQRRFLRALGNWAANELRASGVEVHDPHGGFYLFVDFTPVTAPAVRQSIGTPTSTDFFSMVLKETGVALLGGAGFGMDAEHFVARLAYVTFDGQKVLDFMATAPETRDLTADELGELAPLAVKGVKALAGFAQKLKAMAS